MHAPVHVCDASLQVYWSSERKALRPLDPILSLRRGWGAGACDCDCDCDSFTGKLELSEETERGLSDFGSKVQHLRYLDGSESSPIPFGRGQAATTTPYHLIAQCGRTG